MQVIRRKGTSSPVWPYHATLAERSDMEVVTLDDNPAKDSDEAEAEADKSMTKAEIMEALDELGVEYSASDKKAALKALLDESEQ